MVGCTKSRLVIMSNTFFSAQGHSKDGTSDDICPGTTSELSVEVRAVYKMLENRDAGTACVDDSDEAAEDEFECRARCRMKHIQVRFEFFLLDVCRGCVF